MITRRLVPDEPVLAVDFPFSLDRPSVPRKQLAVAGPCHASFRPAARVAAASCRRCGKRACRDARDGVSRRRRSGSVLGQRKTRRREGAVGRAGAALSQRAADRGTAMVPRRLAARGARRRVVDRPAQLRAAVGRRAQAASGRRRMAAGALHGVRDAGSPRQLHRAHRQDQGGPRGRAAGAGWGGAVSRRPPPPRGGGGGAGRPRRAGRRGGRRAPPPGPPPPPRGGVASSVSSLPVAKA